MALEIREYREGDIARMNLRTVDMFGEDPESKIRDFACTIVNEEGHPVACVGMVVVYEGVGYGWAYIANEAWEHKKWMIKTMRREIPLVMKNIGIHRLQITVQRMLINYVKFAAMLGFEVEGLMVAATPNKTDLVMMARVEIDQ